ncbi:MAG: helix-turn-helix transcriptional regulator [Alphaproteobacteria bacterium]|nr:helix-turn-helix transcriptional regulator [Alphaproteobacteria bacterium]
MLKHADIWAAIDRLAAEHGMSASGLARRAGLDATAFNKSKRINPQGKPRWPTTESIARIMEATGGNFADFVRALGPSGGAGARRYPLIGMARAGRAGYFDDAGYPAGHGWDELEGPDIGDAGAYALRIAGDSMVPAFRPGDIVIVSPEAPVRRGDRVVVRTHAGEVMAKELLRRNAREVALRSVNEAYEDLTFAAREIDWIARIVWARQ